MELEVGRLKGLLGIAEEDCTHDCSLEFVLEDVRETILNFCNLSELPDGLVHAAYRMAMELYRYECPGSGNAPAVVSSISEGDTSTSFTSAADALSGGILKDYQARLNRYRKLRW